MMTPQRIDKILADTQLARDTKVQAVRGVVIAATNAVRTICGIKHDATPGTVYGLTDARTADHVECAMVGCLVEGVMALELSVGAAP